MDGANGLGKNNQIVEGYTSAEWYVQFMEQELKKSFQEKPEASIKEVVKATIEKAKKEVEDFEKENQILLTEYRRSRKSKSKSCTKKR